MVRMAFLAGWYVAFKDAVVNKASQEGVGFLCRAGEDRKLIECEKCPNGRNKLSRQAVHILSQKGARLKSLFAIREPIAMV